MARDYIAEFQALLPSGAAMPRAPDSVQTEFARAMAAEFARVDERAAQLLLEMDPRTTTELVADWERITGLPDPCLDSAPTTLAGRRAAIVSRLIARGDGGPSVPSLTDIIVALGYDRDHVVFRRFHHEAFTCESACTDALDPDEAGWMYLWEIVALHGALDATLKCQISDRYALAHLALTFAFPLFAFEDGTFSRAGSGVLTDPDTSEQVALGPDELGTFYFGV